MPVPAARPVNGAVAQAAVIRAKFSAKCEEFRPHWDAAITAAIRDARERGQERTAAQIGPYITRASEKDTQRLDLELTSMVFRTNVFLVIGAFVLTVLGVLQLPGSTPSLAATVLQVVTATVTVAGLATACYPLTPPIRRAWKDDYDPRQYRNILIVDDFTEFALNSWLGNRRTPIITIYKKSHSVASPLLVAGLTGIIPTMVVTRLL